MRVEQETVHEGGQAVVGDIDPGRSVGNGKWVYLIDPTQLSRNAPRWSTIAKRCQYTYF